jgi:polyisoprenoid-binding protein YceI
MGTALGGRFSIRRWLWTVLPLVVLSGGRPAGGQPADELGRIPFRILGGSSLVEFEAHATSVGAFHGNTRDVSGVLFVDLSALAKGVRGTISVGAATLRTGNSLRDADLQVTMDTAHYPVIRFTPSHVNSPTPMLTVGDRQEVMITGTLEIHGAARSVQLPAGVTRVASNRLEIQGRMPVRMTDYGIRPPQVFFVIRVQDEVQVDFRLVVESAG